MIYVYTYYNKKAAFYDQPFFAPFEKEAMAETVRRAMIMEPAQAKQVHRDECDLYFLGTFDDKTGKFDLLSNPDFILACEQFFQKKEGDAA